MDSPWVISFAWMLFSGNTKIHLRITMDCKNMRLTQLWIRWGGVTNNYIRPDLLNNLVTIPDFIHSFILSHSHTLSHSFFKTCNQLVNESPTRATHPLTHFLFSLTIFTHSFIHSPTVNHLLFLLTHFTHSLAHSLTPTQLFTHHSSHLKNPPKAPNARLCGMVGYTPGSRNVVFSTW